MNTIIAIDPSSELTNESLKKMEFLKNSDVYFVHAVKEYYNGYDILLNSQITFEQDKKEIKDSIENRLREISKEILPYGFSGKTSHHCIFGFDPQFDLVKFAKEKNADLMIVFTRKEHSFLDDSFAYYCGLHAPCDVLVVRENNHDVFKGTIKVTAGMKVDEKSLSKFSLKKYPFLNRAKIEFLHISPRSRFAIEYFPKAEKELVIKDVVQKRISELSRTITPEDFQGSIKANCEFSNNVRKSFSDHANNSDSDLIVLLQKEKTFGNFYHYQLTHTDANVLILRDQA